MFIQGSRGNRKPRFIVHSCGHQSSVIYSFSGKVQDSLRQTHSVGASFAVLLQGLIHEKEITNCVFIVFLFYIGRIKDAISLRGAYIFSTP
jgi:hypothetical protein